MYLLVDLANTNVSRGLHRPNKALITSRLDEMIGRLTQCITAQLPTGFHDLNFRLYDGWYDSNGGGTDLLGMVRSHVHSAYPTRRRRFRIFVRVADAIAAVPEHTLIDTYRTESGLNRYDVSFASPPTLCVCPSDCSYDHLRGWFRGSCPHSQKCSVSTTDVVSYSYQKLIDTAIVADAVWYATNGHAVAVVSDDEDIIPGLLTARSFGVFVLWVSRNQTPKVAYAALIAAKGIEFVTC